MKKKHALTLHTKMVLCARQAAVDAWRSCQGRLQGLPRASGLQLSRHRGLLRGKVTSPSPTLATHAYSLEWIVALIFSKRM